MLPEGSWILLHGGHGGSEVSFQVVFWGLVGLLAVVGALQFAGVFEPAGSRDEGKRESNTDD